MFFKNWQAAILLAVGLHSIDSSEAFGRPLMKESLNKFRTQKQGALQEFDRSFFQHHFDEVCISKGGIGVISQNVYVETQKEQNIVRLGNLKYVGKLGSDRQLIFTDGSNILTPEQAKLSKNLIVIAFSPTQISFYLENADREGKYMRR